MAAATSVVLYPNAPFAMIRPRKVNGGAEATVTKSVAALRAAVDVGQPASKLKTFGTGGLLAADKNPGSYAWLAVVEPAVAERRGVRLAHAGSRQRRAVHEA